MFIKIRNFTINTDFIESINIWEGDNMLEIKMRRNNLEIEFKKKDELIKTHDKLLKFIEAICICEEF